MPTYALRVLRSYPPQPGEEAVVALARLVHRGLRRLALGVVRRGCENRLRDPLCIRGGAATARGVVRPVEALQGVCDVVVRLGGVLGFLCSTSAPTCVPSYSGAAAGSAPAASMPPGVLDGFTGATSGRGRACDNTLAYAHPLRSPSRPRANPPASLPTSDCTYKLCTPPCLVDARRPVAAAAPHFRLEGLLHLLLWSCHPLD